MHIVAIKEGGVGMWSTAKMVHQLLAGIHIVVAAETLELAAKAGLDVGLVYDIVCGAFTNFFPPLSRSSVMVDSRDTNSEGGAMVNNIILYNTETIKNEELRFESSGFGALSYLDNQPIF